MESALGVLLRSLQGERLTTQEKARTWFGVTRRVCARLVVPLGRVLCDSSFYDECLADAYVAWIDDGQPEDTRALARVRIRAVTKVIRFVIQRHGLVEYQGQNNTVDEISIMGKLLPVAPSWTQRAVYMVERGHISPQSLVGKIVVGTALAVGERMSLVRIRTSQERRDRFLKEYGLTV